MPQDGLPTTPSDAAGRRQGATLTGFARTAGAPGVRNHVLVLPSVVCSSHAAGQIASAAGAVGITHQHGCLHVGDDLRHTERAFAGVAANPNVGAVVVVSLGCETLNGKKLADRIAQAGQRTEIVGVQHSGGTAHAVRDGVAACAQLSAHLDAMSREPFDTAQLLVGIDAADDPIADSVAAALEARGARAVDAGGVRGAESHVELASAGAQVIVSLRGEGEGPIGFAVCPVVAAGRDPELLAALRDDFDVDATGDPGEAAERIADAVLAAADGQQTASERRGARDFVLRRLSVTM